MRPRIHHVDSVGAFLSREALHEKVIAFAEAEFDRRGQCPFIWAIYDGNDIVWIETPWEDDREKYASIRLIREMLKVANARAYSNAVEAWVSSYHVEKDGNPEDEKFVPPSQRPKNERDDVLMVITYDKGGKWQGTRYKVTVRERGYNFLGPRDDESFQEYQGEKGHFEGIMFNLFKEESS